MEEIKRPNGAGDLDDIHIAGATEHDGHVAHFGAFVVQPEIGKRFVGLRVLAGGGVGVDEVLPAGGVVVGDERGEGLRSVESGLRVAIRVDGDGGERRGRAVAEEILRGLQHRAIEGEGDTGGGLIGQVGQGVIDALGLLRREGEGCCKDNGEKRGTETHDG